MLFLKVEAFFVGEESLHIILNWELNYIDTFFDVYVYVKSELIEMLPNVLTYITSLGLQNWHYKTFASVLKTN